MTADIPAYYNGTGLILGESIITAIITAIIAAIITAIHHCYHHSNTSLLYTTAIHHYASQEYRRPPPAGDVLMEHSVRPSNPNPTQPNQPKLKSPLNIQLGPLLLLDQHIAPYMYYHYCFILRSDEIYTTV